MTGIFSDGCAVCADAIANYLVAVTVALTLGQLGASTPESPSFITQLHQVCMMGGLDNPSPTLLCATQRKQWQGESVRPRALDLLPCLLHR